MFETSTSTCSYHLTTSVTPHSSVSANSSAVQIGSCPALDPLGDCRGVHHCPPVLWLHYLRRSFFHLCQWRPSKMMLGISGDQWMVAGVADFQMRFRPKDGFGRDPPLGRMGSEVPMVWIWHDLTIIKHEDRAGCYLKWQQCVVP